MEHRHRHQSFRHRFNQQASDVLPGWKTRLTVALGSVGNLAFLAQGYLSGLPLDKLSINPLHLVVANVVLFTLAYWFRSLSDNHA